MLLQNYPDPFGIGHVTHSTEHQVQLLRHTSPFIQLIYQFTNNFMLLIPELSRIEDNDWARIVNGKPVHEFS